jgi:hypothetical protein
MEKGERGRGKEKEEGEGDREVSGNDKEYIFLHPEEQVAYQK